MARFWIILLIVLCVLAGIGEGIGLAKENRVENAIQKNKLKKAEKRLRKLHYEEKKNYYGRKLIDAYMYNDNVDRAMYVFDNLTELESDESIYDALIEDARYDEAWKFHKNNSDYYSNADEYFSYMTDVILSMCSTGRSVQVPRFIKTKSIWFTKNVDNYTGNLGDYSDYTHAKATSRLYQIYNDLNRINELEKSFNAAQFAPGKAELSTRAMAVLNDLAKEMKKRPEISLRIVGHTSAEGDPAFNQKLSEERALVAVDYLVSQGISADRFEAEGKGSSEPIDVNNLEANRRTEFIVID